MTREQFQQLKKFCQWEKDHPDPKGRVHIAQAALDEIIRLRKGNATLNSEIMRLRARVAELEGTLKWFHDEVLEYQNEEPVSVLSRDEEARIVHVIENARTVDVPVRLIENGGG